MSDILKSIDGQIYDILQKDNTLKSVDGQIYNILQQQSLSAIGYIKYYTGSLITTLPIYKTSDILKNQLRINTPSGIGSFNLVWTNDPLSSSIRISTNAGIMCLAKL